MFFVIEVKSRAVEIAGIAVDPGKEWMKQVGPTNDNGTAGKVVRRSRLGGLLNYYHCEAA